MPKLLNSKQLAEYLQIHRVTIYKWVKQGRLPKPISRRGSPRWDGDEVVRYLRAGGFPSDGVARCSQSPSVPF